MKLFLLYFFELAASIADAKTFTPRLQPRQSVSTPGLTKPNFTTIFLDQFTGSAGTLPSTTNWLFDVGTSYPGGPAKWGNSESETYTNSTNNIQITHQNTLQITPHLSRGVWTSARIETARSDFAAEAGGRLYIESRIKLGNATAAKQQGIWPAFWALGSSFRGNYSNWPMTSELDFLEAVNGGNTMYSTVHCGTAPGGPCNEYNGIGSGGVPFSRGAWHTVGFLVDRSMCGRGSASTWVDETLTWYLDGSQVFTVSGQRVGDQKAWASLAHDGHFLLLNIAVGGSWPGAPNSQTIDGVTVGMEVDYVGVWKST